MKSAAPGRSTSQVEVTNVSPHGFWLLIREEELFVPFKEFPWFKKASIAEITGVELPSPHHLYWPDLDIDLAVESIKHPERYPLVSEVQPNRPLQPTSRAKRRAKAKPRSRAARG
jgi:hypothetical protein